MDISIQGYNLDNELCRSSKSIIYNASRQSDNEKVVIKTLLNTKPSSIELAKFKYEFKILDKFSTNGIIKNYGIEKSKNGYAIIMEYGGLPLYEFNRHGDILLDQFYSIAIQIVESLSKVHEKSVIHKDLNPSNILYNEETGKVSIIDFGISSELSRERTNINVAGHLEGSLPYISPEQTGRMNRELDYRTDFYSLGITFFDLLTGDLPFKANDDIGWVHSHIAKQPADIKKHRPDIPDELQLIIQKMMSKKAENRYQSTFGLLRDLEKSYNSYKNGLTIKNFSPGTEDIPGTFAISQKLYGRQEQIDTLLQAYDRVASGSCEFILVSGYSGVGKSALVNEIHRPIVEKRGYFIEGKYDQFQRDVVYSGLVQAFKSFVNQILIESSDQIQFWRKKIIRELGLNAGILTELIPNMEMLTGKLPPAPDVNPAEASNRFKIVIKQFLRLIATIENPLTIFLDDLHWCDYSSLEMMKEIIISGEIKYLLFIGAFRDNEILEENHLLLHLDEIDKQRSVLTLSLSPLDENSIYLLIQDSFKTSNEKSAKLAKCIYRKTDGNPFFVNELLKHLYLNTDINFSLEKGAWEWDIVKINEAEISNNLVDFLIENLKNLSESNRDVLKIAACIGNVFDLDTLAQIYGKSIEFTNEDLWEVLKQGMVIPLSGNYRLIRQSKEDSEKFGFGYRPKKVIYKFQHDRVRHAAYTLIDEDCREELHLQIGRHLYKKYIDEKKEDLLAEIVRHLNIAKDQIVDENEILQLTLLNRQMGEKAIKASAYKAAYTYLANARNLLLDGCWESNYDVALDINKAFATAAYLSGEFLIAECAVKLLLESVKTDIEKAQIFHMQSLQYTVMEKSENAISAAINGLNVLGMKINNTPSILTVALELISAKMNVNKKTIPDIIDAPTLSDQKNHLKIKLLLELATPAFLTGNENLVAICVLKSLKLTLKYGNIPESAFAYIGYSMILTNLGDLKSANEIGKVVLTLSDRYYDLKNRCRVLYIYTQFIHHWNNHWEQLEDMFKQTVNAGFSSGDLFYLGFAATNCVAYIPTISLQEQEERLNKYYKISQSTGFQDSIDDIRLLIQRNVCLQGKTENNLTLSNANFNEQKFIERIEKENKHDVMAPFWLFKAEIAFLNDDYINALTQIQKIGKSEKTLIGQPFIVKFTLLSFLIRIKLLPILDGKELRQAKKECDKRYKQVCKWASYNPVNYRHLRLIMESEYARYMKKNTAQDLYTAAIKGASEGGWLLHEALFNELFGTYWMEIGNEKTGILYLSEAKYRYELWGAYSKVKRLLNEHPQIIDYLSNSSSKHNDNEIEKYKRHTSNRKPSTSTQSTDLDLNAVMKASQTISEEIVFSKLLKNIIDIVIENAGAQRGFIILNRGEKLLIEAMVDVDKDEIIIEQGLPLEDKNILSVGVVEYVARTGEKVILNNASYSGSFTRDPYILQTKPKSIFCMPIMRQDKIQGVVYLENNLTDNAFSEDRVQVLTILLSQAAISLENARLFDLNLQTQDELGKSERHHRQLLETMNDGFLILDSDQKISYVNRKLTKILGYSRDYLIGTKVEEFIAEKDAEIALVSLNQHIKNVKSVAQEIELIKYDQTIVPVIISPQPMYDSDGTYTGSFSVIVDITERKESEQKVRNLQNLLGDIINSMPSILIGVDINGKIMQWNSEAERYVGKSRSEVAGEPVSEVFPFLKEHLYILKESIDNGKEVIRNSVPEFINNEETFWDLTVYPIGGSNVTGAVIRADNITDVHRMEEQLKQSDKMRAIGQLAGGIAHDFNNQLTGIMANAEIIKLEIDNDSEIHQYVNDIITSAKRSADLTNQLLAYARKGKYVSKPVDLHKLIAEVISLLQRSINKKISIRQEMYATSSIITGDPSQLQNALLNLAINARDAMNDEGEIIFKTVAVDLDKAFCIKCQCEIAPGTYLKVAISDTGTGIDNDSLLHIFEPFFTTKPEGKGTGMGLAAVYGTVRNHSGTIEVETEVGKGTEFSIYLPLDTITPKLKDKNEEGQRIIKGKGNIIVVDDEEVICRTLENILTKIGYNVQIFYDGKSALEKFNKSFKEIDLVILDMLMPEMDGRELYSEMKNLHPEVKAVLSTGFTVDGSAQSLLDEGINGFIQKPFNLSNLSKVVSDVIKN